MSTQNRLICHFFLLLLTSMSCGLVQATEDTPAPAPLVVGVVPQQSAVKLARDWAPLLNMLSKRSGLNLVFATAPNIPVFEQRVREGAYDLAYMNPYHYTVFHNSMGYTALVRAQDSQIEGIYVVRRDSLLQTLEQLSGLELAYPAPAAFAASIVTQANLAKVGELGPAAYVLSHDAVYRAVAANRYAAGGGIIRTFNTADPQVRSQLRILWVSPGYTPHPIASHPRVSQAQRQRLLQALTELALDSEGRALLEPLGIQGFVRAEDSDWDDVRALKLHRLN